MVYLDDERTTPEGWVRTYSVPETIELLKKGGVTHLSLDNDLGEGQLEGRHVAGWIEFQTKDDPTFEPPDIQVHSANPVAASWMKAAIANIIRYREERNA